MEATAERRWRFSFWQVQLVGWGGFYGLLLLAAGPRLGERDIFRYNTVACGVLFCGTLMLRTFCRAATVVWRSSRLALEAGMFAFCLLLGVLATFATGFGTFGWKRLDGSNWQLSWLQCAIILYIWCHLYISMRRSDYVRLESRAEPLQLPNFLETGGTTPANATSLERLPTDERHYLVRTGSRIKVVREDAVLWFSAAGDYVELHTATGTHLVRETMRKIQASLDPATFVRIHRSRIVRCAQIAELTALENGEYRVRLRDGSDHRSSRTYAPLLKHWLTSGASDDVGGKEID